MTSPSPVISPPRSGWERSPPSAFYDDPGDGATLIRFAFCQPEEVLVEAVRRLGALLRRPAPSGAV